MNSVVSRKFDLIAKQIAIVCFVLFFAVGAQAADRFQESGGKIVIEAEEFHSKANSGVREWYAFPTSSSPTPDPDGSHISGASGGGYVEVLPDKRVVHDDPFVYNDHFFLTGDDAPRMNFNIRINTAGRYYVFGRFHSTGAEDNSVHFGVDNNWPDSGKSMQVCKRNVWWWTNGRRVGTDHCGEKHRIYLDLTSGDHTLMVAMREDGAELDQFILSTDADFFPAGNSDPTNEDPSNDAPTVTAGPDQTVAVGQVATLDGSATDDGVPDDTLTIEWTLISGPGVADIVDSSSLKTEVSFNAEGLYVLELSVGDGDKTGSDKIGFNVVDASLLPTVDAGEDFTITVNTGALMNGILIAEEIPKDEVTFVWNVISGPGVAEISDAADLNAQVLFDAIGEYVLELSAQYGELQHTDQITIQVVEETEDPSDPVVDDDPETSNSDSSGCFIHSLLSGFSR